MSQRQGSLNARSAATPGETPPELAGYIKSGILKVVVKPNAPETEIVGYRDDSVIIAVKEKAEDGKANAAVVKFLQKETGGMVRLLRGATSHRKVFKIEMFK